MLKLRVFIIVWLMISCPIKLMAYDGVITVININKSIYFLEKKDDALQHACTQWAFNKDDVRRIFSLSNVISGEQKHDLYYDVPCEISGKIIIDKQPYDFIINAASHIELIDAKGQYSSLGCNVDECTYLFLLPSRSNE